VTNQRQIIQRQTTLRKPIHCAGVGVHSNVGVSLTMLPAPADTGIRFHRTDLGANAVIAAHADNVIDTTLCTVLGAKGFSGALRVATVEHLMAALAGAGIDNATLEIDGPEVPVMDGSSAPFVFLLECAGTQMLNAPRRGIQVLEEIRVDEGNRMARILPADRFSLSCTIEFDHALIGNQSVGFDYDGNFSSELSRARTFCMEDDVLKMRAAGLALGGSLDNAVVFSNDSVLNEGGLRYQDEPARHKALDLFGDLTLAGAPIIGRVETFRAGHAMNHRLVTALLENTAAWRMVDMVEHDVLEDMPIAAAGGGA
jgi:UDP-3-O-[3-hydroxymyristoyl] N-acetylglucosamine deacetylase